MLLKSFAEVQAKRIQPPPERTERINAFLDELSSPEHRSSARNLQELHEEEAKATREELQQALAIAHYVIRNYCNGGVLVSPEVIEESVDVDVFIRPTRNGDYVVWTDEWRPEVAPGTMPGSAEGAVDIFDDEPSGDIEVDRRGIARPANDEL